MNKIIILGGGSAGWMTAATLIKAFPNRDITLIESPNTPTVGVGESTIGQIRQWTKYLEIDDKDFIPHTDASLKLSIKFTDFYKKGQEFHYPFGQVVENDKTDAVTNLNVKTHQSTNMPLVSINVGHVRKVMVLHLPRMIIGDKHKHFTPSSAKLSNHN